MTSPIYQNLNIGKPPEIGYWRFFFPLFLTGEQLSWIYEFPEINMRDIQFLNVEIIQVLLLATKLILLSLIFYFTF